MTTEYQARRPDGQLIIVAAPNARVASRLLVKYGCDARDIRERDECCPGCERPVHREPPVNFARCFHITCVDCGRCIGCGQISIDAITR